VVFWVVTSCSVVIGYKRFGGLVTCFFTLETEALCTTPRTPRLEAPRIGYWSGTSWQTLYWTSRSDLLLSH